MTGWLTVFSGLPGVGKTTLAQSIAAELAAVYLRVDSAEAGIRASNLAPPDVMDAGYQALWALAEENLALGWTVIADNVNPIDLTRSGWAKTASSSDALLSNVLVICSDLEEHKGHDRSSRALGWRLRKVMRKNPGERWISIYSNAGGCGDSPVSDPGLA